MGQGTPTRLSGPRGTPPVPRQVLGLVQKGLARERPGQGGKGIRLSAPGEAEGRTSSSRGGAPEMALDHWVASK